MDELELLHLLRRAAQHSRAAGEESGASGAPHRERERVLSLLDETEGVSQRKLALILGIRPQSLSELLLKLEKDGLVQRDKNPDDRRETLVSLTSKGRERAAVFETGCARAAEAFLAPLTGEERDTLAGLLEKLLSGAGEAE